MIAWFDAGGRDYPWRRTTDPYAILVSEVMLQQTQIATVLGRGFYSRFLEKFPDARTLAEADDESLLKTWEGLGYYRRARMLRETARAVTDVHQGKFPSDPEALMALPGVGRYTAGAMRAFAFDLPAVVVDGNVARVLARLMDSADPVDEPAGLTMIWQWAEELSDHSRPRAYHAALMELGQRICRPGVPDCLSCPVSGFCRTREPEALPVKKRKIAITGVEEHAVWLVDDNGRLLLHREAAKRREGLWKLPTRGSEALAGLPVLMEHRYSITRFRVNLKVHDGNAIRRKFQLHEDEFWHGMTDALALAMPAPFRRVIERLSVEI